MAQTQKSYRVRKDFSKIPPIIDIPDLIEIQKSSYERFLQRDISGEGRDDMGLQGAFQSVFPISDFNDTATIEFVEYSLGEPKYEERECLERGTTYAAPLRIKVRLVLWEKSEETGARTVKDIKEQEVYLGTLPLMSENGTFIINGTERVVVSQLHRSPGVFFAHDKGKTHPSGKVLYSCRVIPYRGSWLDFDFNIKDVLYVRIDRRRKFPATVVLKALGFTDVELLRMFYPVEKIHFTEGGFIRTINPEVLVGTKATATIVDKATNDAIVREGHKITKSAIKKMEAAGITQIPITEAELLERFVLEDVVDTETGEIIISGNEKLTEGAIAKVRAANVGDIEVLFIDNINYTAALRDTLLSDKTSSADEAMVEIYKRMRPGEPPTLEMARSLFDGMFFNAKRYDLSPMGRLKINKKLGLKIPLETRTLSKEDIIETIRYLLNLKTGKGSIDDIDHLGNRRVRSVGELLENQFRIGLVRMERTVKERMSLLDIENAMPHDLINAKAVTAAIKEFFGSSQLSQFMDQTNPLAEITHKRRLSALGPGGLARERAGFEVRDVHPTHYGRICPIETPEGPNIGLITSLATYGRVNEFGFIEAPYRKVTKGRVTDEVEYLSALDGEKYAIAQANTPLAEDGNFAVQSVSARVGGEFKIVTPEEVDYMDVSPKQMVSVSASLIPFLENDDANRALMGSNMQRQAVPLLKSQAPYVGTGMERAVARDSGVVESCKRAGVVESVDAFRIVVRVDQEVTGKKGKKEKEAAPMLDSYSLVKFYRSNQNTCITQKPIVKVGERVEKGQILADGPCTDMGELALGQNVMVAFMPWCGYNFEDAIVISETMVQEDRYTSIHIEEFEIEARDTKLGKEEITRDLPNVSEEALKNLDESGIIRIGAEVKPGDILVGKVTPKGETQLTPEEKLLRAIFGEKAGDVKDASLSVPPGIDGVVVDVKIFSRKGIEKDERAKLIESEEISRLERDYKEEIRIVREEKSRKLREMLLGQTVQDKVVNADGDTVIAKGKKITESHLDLLSDEDIINVQLESREDQKRLENVEEDIGEQLDYLNSAFDDQVERMRRDDELPPGVIKLIKVYVAMKRKLQVGDKMAGRHGNKGVIAKVVPVQDMPYLPDGRPVDLVLNPLGVPSRMNVGQILETHLGWAAAALGMRVATPVFEGATEKEITGLLKKAGLPETGQTVLCDGMTGEPFERPVTVGYMYMLKLHHLVDDKIHARSIGPYSLVTQQPLGGKAQFGGQRLGEMEVWALEAYGAAHTLQEFLTVKSDDVQGRARIYEAIVKGENTLEPGMPESFNVLLKELQSLCLDVELVDMAGAATPAEA